MKLDCRVPDGWMRWNYKGLENKQLSTTSKNLGVGVGIRMEGDLPHGMGNLTVLHEAIPYKAAAQILCHQHTDTHVDSDHVIAVPAGFGLEGIAKSITPVKLIPKSF